MMQAIPVIAQLHGGPLRARACGWFGVEFEFRMNLIQTQIAEMLGFSPWNSHIYLEMYFRRPVDSVKSGCAMICYLDRMPRNLVLIF